MLVALVLASALASVGPQCSAPWGPSRPTGGGVTGYHRELVAEAAIVVRVRALPGVMPASTPDSIPWPATRVRFVVLETLKGNLPAPELALPGVLVTRDEYTPQRRPPFRGGRPSTRRGACFTYEYRAGREYLLFLRELAGALVPYWAPIAPVNEQLRGASDPWLAWVRQAAQDTAAGEPVK